MYPHTVDRGSDGRSSSDWQSAERLDGWKEIASYLGRGERTVKRWEERGLPIHRLPGEGRASVHAYKHELDGWLGSNKSTETQSAVPVAEMRPAAEVMPQVVVQTAGTSRSHVIGTLYVFAVVITAVSFWFAHEVRAERDRTHAAASSVSSSEAALSRDLYQRGRVEWNKRTTPGLNAALNDFTQAIVHDPGNAYAYSGLADTYTLLAVYGSDRDREGFKRGIAAANKAVELDDNLAEAHRSRGFAEIWGDWDFRDGERELRRAIQLNPQDPLTHLWYATALKSPAWKANAAQEFERAQQLDPSSAIVVTNKSIWLFENGDQRRGLDLAQQVEAANPLFVGPHQYLAQMYWHLRDYPSFLREGKTLAQIGPDATAAKIVEDASAAFRKNGEAGLLQSLYASQQGPYLGQAVSGVPFPEVCIRLGKLDQAFGLLQDDYAHRRPQFLIILTQPELIALQDDPRYQSLRKLLDYPDPPPADR